MSEPARGPIRLEPHRPEWASHFEALRARLLDALGPSALAVEHIGSTAVPGLVAKPILDVDVVIGSAANLPEAAARLARLGYRHEGDLGVAGREAFVQPPATMAHHLYVLAQDAAELERHLRFRDHLRQHPADALAYARLKCQLAREVGDDRQAYSEGKTAFVDAILAAGRPPS